MRGRCVGGESDGDACNPVELPTNGPRLIRTGDDTKELADGDCVTRGRCVGGESDGDAANPIEPLSGCVCGRGGVDTVTRRSSRGGELKGSEAAACNTVRIIERMSTHDNETMRKCARLCESALPTFLGWRCRPRLFFFGGIIIQ